jgi:hypothetical protein
MSNETNRISNEILSISDAGPRDVSKLAPVKFWGEPEPPIEVTLDGVDGEKRFFRFQAGSVPTPRVDDNYASAGEFAGIEFELYRNIGCIERLTNFGDRAPLLDHIKRGDLNTDEMRAFFTALILGNVSIPVGNPATLAKHKDDLRIARFVAVLIAYGGRREKVYALAAQRFGANKHHTYSSRHITRIYRAHRDEAWTSVMVIKGLFSAIVEGDPAVLIRPYLMEATGITEGDIRSTSARRKPAE